MSCRHGLTVEEAMSLTNGTESEILPSVTLGTLILTRRQYNTYTLGRRRTPIVEALAS